MAISAGPYFKINPSISFFVNFDPSHNKDAAINIDTVWEKLSAVPEAEQCGWLKDKFGVSWQIVPTAMDKMMGAKDKNKLAKVTQAFLKMKKFDIKDLERAYNQSKTRIVLLSGNSVLSLIRITKKQKDLKAKYDVEYIG